MRRRALPPVRRMTAAPPCPSAKRGKRRACPSGRRFCFRGAICSPKRVARRLTSIAGSIGIISVCLVLSSVQRLYQLHQPDGRGYALYYPLEITETSLDPTSIMAGLQTAGGDARSSELDNKVYVNSFLTQIAQGLTVAHEITQEGYLEYLYEMRKTGTTRSRRTRRYAGG